MTACVLEEDGDEVFTPMDACYRWTCREWPPGNNFPVRPALIERNGFMVCPKCGGSYGPAQKATQP